MLYWLSVTNNDDNKHFNQIMAYKDIASGYSRFHSMVLQNILHRFSKGEREVKIRDGKEKDTFRPETSLVSSASGSGTKSSDMLNILGLNLSVKLKTKLNTKKDRMSISTNHEPLFRTKCLYGK